MICRGAIHRAQIIKIHDYYNQQGVAVTIKSEKQNNRLRGNNMKFPGEVYNAPLF